MITLEKLNYLLLNAKTTSEEPVEEHFDQIVHDIDQDKTADAAKLIELVFAKGAADVRLIFYYAYAHFAEHGISSFKETFPFIISLLNDYPHILLPQNKVEKHIQNSLNWFFSHLLFRIKYYEKMHAAGKVHPIWKKSTSDISSDELERVITIAEAMRKFFFEKYPESSTKDKVTHLLKKIEGLRLHVKPSPAKLDDEIKQAEPLAQENSSFNQTEKHHQPISSEQSADSDGETTIAICKPNDLSEVSNQYQLPSQVDLELNDSQASLSPLSCLDPHIDQSLLQNYINDFLLKLDAFETLVDKNDHLKAAIVAQDINLSIDSFDPANYFPKIFAKYFSLLARHVTALSEQAIHKDSMQFQVLQKLYQTDKEMFIEW